MYKDKFQKYTYFVCDYNIIDEIIQEQYPSVIFECALDMQNGSTIKVSTGYTEFDIWERQDLEKFLSGEIPQQYNTLRLLLQDLTNKQILEADNYLINVSW
jgi:hypothetical protein